MRYYLNKNRLFLFWSVGKFAFEAQKREFVSDRRMVEFLQYYFGMSETFSLSNVKTMIKFYVSFPIYTEQLEKLDWNYYLKLLEIKNHSKRMYYYRVAIFSECDFDTFNELLRKKR